MVTRKRASVPKQRLPRESEIERAILDALFWRSDVLVWKSHVGVARLVGRGGRVRPVQFGLAGQADISGVIEPWGVALFVEVKRPGEVQRATQVLFEQRVRAAGAVYFVATSVNDAMQRLNDTIAELRSRFGGTT